MLKIRAKQRSQFFNLAKTHLQNQFGARSIVVAYSLHTLGIILSFFTLYHYITVRAVGSTNAFCNISLTVNCDKVALSKWAALLSMPLGLWGIGFFLAAGLLFAIGVSRSKFAEEHIQSYVALVVIGIVSSFALMSISLFIIGSFCLYCFGIYVTIIFLGAHIWVFRKKIPKCVTITNLVNGCATALIVIVLCILGWTLLKPTSENLGNVSGLDVFAIDQSKINIPIYRSPELGQGQEYRLGPDDALVTLIVFFDFQCMPCRKMSELIFKLHEEFPKNVQTVFKNYPLDKNCNTYGSEMHKWACEAAAIARCVGLIRGRFWEYYKQVYDNQDSISSKTLRAWAANLGVSASELENCLVSSESYAKIKDDIVVGDKANVSATPTVFINGYRYTGGLSYPALRFAVLRVMKQSNSDVIYFE